MSGTDADSRWAALQHAVNAELSFPPPYQMKLVHAAAPHPPDFDADVGYWGDWSDESLAPFAEIEWLRVRPRYLKHRGRLVAPEVVDIEAEFVALLDRLGIRYTRDRNAILITLRHGAET